MAFSRTDVCNSALGYLGDAPAFFVDVDTDTSKPAKIFRQFIDPTRKGVLRQFPWNCAMERAEQTLGVITGAADNGAGLIRVTKASHGFSTGNRVGISSAVGTTEANGEWFITVISSSTFDLIGSTFTNAWVSGGYVSLAAAFGYRHRHALPSNSVRFLKMGEDSEGANYQLEKTHIYTDETTIQFWYLADFWPTATTDYTNMDALLYECLALLLAWKACYAITGSNTLKDQLWKDYRTLMPRARFVDSTENPQKRISADEWLLSREAMGAGRFVRDPMTH